MKHLQNIGLIPTTSSLIVLNSDQITATSQMSNAENVKHLVLVIGKRMYYGSIGKQGAEDRHGILIFEDGAYYEGEIKAGKMDG